MSAAKPRQQRVCGYCGKAAVAAVCDACKGAEELPPWIGAAIRDKVDEQFLRIFGPAAERQ